MFDLLYGAVKPIDSYTKSECLEMYQLWFEKAKVDLFFGGYLAAMPSQIAAAFWYNLWEKK